MNSIVLLEMNIVVLSGIEARAIGNKKLCKPLCGELKNRLSNSYSNSIKISNEKAFSPGNSKKASCAQVNHEVAA